MRTRLEQASTRLLDQEITLAEKVWASTKAFDSSSRIRGTQRRSSTPSPQGHHGPLDEQLGIKPSGPSPEPDLTDVLKENLSQLPTAVKELVEKITRPPPEMERDMAQKLKAQVSTLRDLSHRKQVLQHKLDQAKKTYGDMLDEMKGIQTKLEAEQGALNSTSSAYMALVNTNKPVEGLQAGMVDDTVPEAVAGFITTLGVNLTDDQKAQLNTMLKRPQPDLNEEET